VLLTIYMLATRILKTLVGKKAFVSKGILKGMPFMIECYYINFTFILSAFLLAYIRVVHSSHLEARPFLLHFQFSFFSHFSKMNLRMSQE